MIPDYVCLHMVNMRTQIEVYIQQFINYKDRPKHLIDN